MSALVLRGLGDSEDLLVTGGLGLDAAAQSLVIVDTQTVVNGSDGSSVVIAKPDGLEVGHMLVAFIGANGKALTLNTPAGWTADSVNTGASLSAAPETYANIGCFYKVADAADVAASDFTFTSSDATYKLFGIVLAVSGASAIDVSGRQLATAANSPVTLTGGVTVTGPSRLFLVCSLYSTGAGITGIAAPALATDDPSWTTTVANTTFNGTSRFTLRTARRSASSASGDITQAVTGGSPPSIYGIMAVIAVREELLRAHGTISLSAHAFLYSDNPFSAHGAVSLSGHAYFDNELVSHGSVTIAGRAHLTSPSNLRARYGTATLTTTQRPHLGNAYVGPMAAFGAIFTGSAARLASVGEALPARETGLIKPDIFYRHGFALGIEGLTHRAGILDVSIDLSDHGGFIAATIDTAILGGGSAPAMYSDCVIVCGGQTFRGRLESRQKNVGSTAGWTLTYAGPMTKLRDHRGFRRCYVTSDLQGWSTDQGARSSPDTFEVASRTSGNTA